MRLRIQNIASQEFKHLIYRDEIGDSFILTKVMEIYRKTKTTIGCYCWSYNTLVKLRSKGIIFNEWSTSDGLYLFETNNENLSILIECGSPKRRIHKNGKLLKYREQKLAHRIIPFNPSIEIGKSYQDIKEILL